MNGEVTILTGPPGAGKTTVAAILAADASAPTVHLTTDQFYRSIRTGFVPPYLPEAQRQNEVVVEAPFRPADARSAATCRAADGYQPGAVLADQPFYTPTSRWIGWSV